MTKSQEMNHLHQLRARDHAGPRPWQEKQWPFMRHGQKVRVIYVMDGLLEGREQEVRRLALKWIRRLDSTVKYDLAGKMYVFKEVGPDEEEDPNLWAMVLGYRDAKGKPLQTQEEKTARVRKGNYSLVEIGLLISHWPSFSVSRLEESIVHELLHVVRPQIGHVIQNDRLIEDWDYMNNITRELIKNWGRMSKSDIQTLLKETITDAEATRMLHCTNPAKLNQ